MVDVQRVTLSDHGQDFTEWYVRNGIVIDCQPCQGRVWVGTRLTSPAIPGQAIYYTSSAIGKELILDYPAQAVETLSAEEAAEVERHGLKWAQIKGIPVADLGL
ncbi:hypothetical protein PZT66_24130 [Pseudomonas aeruginosa]|uniref:hypothetical protein n=1 Tax=Pseudomonas aeruginosa group TaxID=136841 RepID=UPI00045028AD|nr:hypothetical protein [Pseudomonas aeruginosa]EIU2716089.1 hypothetical protein [Pseudomonas aeruginosa]EIU2863620.1 hypothetical protein [Pseudomonas aeruginosa]ELD5772832.1 hypothetical protein [Pseudomonas aeruginosa]ETV55916.1 hypothetical protein Q042_05325 [Pseudomonas aeruginosa BWHPSA037]MBA5210168.1 hypothetical protein [Pseudomonas aeruginosa]